MLKLLGATLLVFHFVSCSIFESKKEPEPILSEKVAVLVGEYTFQKATVFESDGSSRILQPPAVPYPETLWIDSSGLLAQANTAGPFTHGFRTGCSATITDMKLDKGGTSGFLSMISPVTSGYKTEIYFEMNDSLLQLHRSVNDSICAPAYPEARLKVIEDWKRILP